MKDRRVGLTTELPDEWAKAVGTAKAPEEFAHLDAEAPPSLFATIRDRLIALVNSRASAQARRT